MNLMTIHSKEGNGSGSMVMCSLPPPPSAEITEHTDFVQKKFRQEGDNTLGKFRSCATYW